MSPEELAAIKERCAQATPGPWTSPWDEAEPDETAAFRAADGEEVVSRAEYDCVGYLTVLEPDARFIAHARTDVPALVDEVERLRAENAGLRAERVTCANCNASIAARDALRMRMTLRSGDVVDRYWCDENCYDQWGGTSAMPLPQSFRVDL